jgi:hypothetical protein
VLPPIPLYSYSASLYGQLNEIVNSLTVVLVGGRALARAAERAASQDRFGKRDPKAAYNYMVQDIRAGVLLHVTGPIATKAATIRNNWPALQVQPGMIPEGIMFQTRHQNPATFEASGKILKQVVDDIITTVQACMIIADARAKMSRRVGQLREHAVRRTFKAAAMYKINSEEMDGIAQYVSTCPGKTVMTAAGVLTLPAYTGPSSTSASHFTVRSATGEPVATGLDWLAWYEATLSTSDVGILGTTQGPGVWAQMSRWAIWHSPEYAPWRLLCVRMRGLQFDSAQREVQTVVRELGLTTHDVQTAIEFMVAHTQRKP